MGPQVRTLIVRGLLGVALVAGAAPAWAYSDGRKTDPWDVSQGTVVTAHSGTVLVSSPNDLLGATDSTVEPGSTIFRDDQSAGFVHFVEWTTVAPITLYGFTLYANDDGAVTGDRGFSEFRLFARNPSTMLFEQISSFTPPGNPYPDNDLVFSAAFSPPVVAQDFRAEFVQFAGTGTAARGPRIRELDAGTSPFGDEDGGFIPPDKAAAKCENAVAKQIAKLLQKSADCTRKTAKAAIKGKTFDEDACNDAIEEKYNSAIAKLKCPLCITSTDLHDIGAFTVDSAAPLIYCAGTVPFGDEGAFVPPDKPTAKCAEGVAKSFSKLAVSIIGCHIKLAKKAFAVKPFDEEACEDKAQQKYDDAQAKRVGCPLCLDAATLASTMRSSMDDQNADIYCAF